MDGDTPLTPFISGGQMIKMMATLSLFSGRRGLFLGQEEVLVKPVTPRQRVLEHLDKPLLFKKILPLATRSHQRSPAWLGPWQRPDETGPNPTAADSNGISLQLHHATGTQHPPHPCTIFPGHASVHTPRLENSSRYLHPACACCSQCQGR